MCYNIRKAKVNPTTYNVGRKEKREMPRRIVQRVLLEDFDDYVETMDFHHIKCDDFVHDENAVYVLFTCTGKNMTFLMLTSPSGTFKYARIRITANGLNKYRIFKPKSCIYFMNLYENVYWLVLTSQGSDDFFTNCSELTEKGLIQIEYLG